VARENELAIAFIVKAVQCAHVGVCYCDHDIENFLQVEIDVFGFDYALQDSVDFPPPRGTAQQERNLNEFSVEAIEGIYVIASRPMRGRQSVKACSSLIRAGRGRSFVALVHVAVARLRSVQNPSIDGCQRLQLGCGSWCRRTFNMALEAIMSTTTANPNNPRFYAPWQRLGEALAKDWWLLALRGLLGVIFGIIALLMPVATILALVLLFSAYMLVDGCVALYTAARDIWRRESWGMPLMQGIASIAAAALTFLWPGITVVVFVILVAAWAIVSGCVMIAAAYNVEGRYGRGWLVFGGIVSLAYGFLMILAPLLGAVVLTWWLGAYSLVFGIALIVLAFRLRSQRNQHPSVAAARPAT
jgi:uncharacterized membrane protein HdeD (DUF308 family)